WIPCLLSRGMAMAQRRCSTIGISYLDDVAKWVSLVDLGTYALAQPDTPEKMWHLASFILMEYGLTLEPNKIKDKYKKAKRKHVVI
ncbi:hypothetical protein, partial [Aeromonas caviae]|uniref:hypothetical protein n=1 Tax=Aeromonas caviae TaxID=648 RepID=UPI002B487137